MNIFDPHDMPGTIPVVGATVCQEVHGPAGRGSIKRPPQGLGENQTSEAASVFPQERGGVQYTSGRGIRQT